MITISVESLDGQHQKLLLPTDMGLSLMEALKANEYEILSTCGGMALCATCHVEVLDGGENLREPSDPEYDLLDTLPDCTDNSRLACQLRLSNEMDGLVIKLKV
ncbi:2Fe-2S iron-sulfur cluster-binding protein [Chondrinema litorale]|uniref:2Fe-2S iron-sulfur cluster-binding protein n=1 Tax=Chondrinema litorale TaxID=2994555 RepID=UPI0025439A96|nr:2Fe-2S iron-sulfur cluster-binding protein [Chondrinema litorale]UZR96846.1 2Fe-2S iron-sulfur cluster-binding protein [Chondrinema litorale]